MRVEPIVGGASVEVLGRRITLSVQEDVDACGQFRVSVSVDGALTGKDKEIWSGHITARDE